MQNAGTEVVDAKAGAGSATLSMAYAAYLFVTACLKAMNGFAGIVECAYVEDSSIEGCDFFAQRVKLGKTGVTHRCALSLTLRAAVMLHRTLLCHVRVCWFRWELLPGGGPGGSETGVSAALQCTP